MMETALKIYTDGGCSGNPGPGGWAYIIIMQTFQGPNIIAQDKGGVKDTTNNKMELTAVIQAFRKLKTMAVQAAKGGVIQSNSLHSPNEVRHVPRQVTVFTDSQYVQKGITEWIHTWKRNSWRTSDKKPVKNQDLWMELDALNNEFSVYWEWVRGHAGNEFNEMCDSMTQEAIAQQQF